MRSSERATRACLLVAILCIGTGMVCAQQSEESRAQEKSAESREAAGLAWKRLQESERENARELNFASADELQSASLGDSLVVFMVELGALSAYKPDSDPTGLLKAIDKVIYPVNLRGETRTSLVMQKSEEGWEAASIGGKNFARLATSARDKVSQENHLTPAALFLVQVPALNAYFIGFHARKQLMLRALIDDPEMNLRADVSLPAQEVFAALVPLAKNHDGLPR